MTPKNLLLLFALTLPCEHLFAKLDLSIENKPLIKEGYHLVNGQQIYYKTLGHDSAPPVLMVHGGPGFDHHHMLGLQTLASNYQLIFYDQRGTGNSQGEVSPQSITMANFISDLDGMRKAFNIEKADIIATSFGGLIALYYATQHPDQINSLTLVASVPARIKDFSEVGDAIKNRTSNADQARLKALESSSNYQSHDKHTLQKYFRIFFKAYAYNAQDAEKLNLEFGQYTTQNMDQINMLMYQNLGDFDLYPKLGSIQSPTLLLHGDSDPFPYQSIEKMHQTIKGSKYILYKNTGHFLYLEKPKQLFEDIETFLSDNIDTQHK